MIGSSWPELLARYERALQEAEVFDAPPLLAAEREVRTRLRSVSPADQAPIAARVREIELRVLGWSPPQGSSDEAAAELRSLGFSERAIVESRRLQ